MTTLENKTIADIVSEHSITAEVFDNYHVDYCTCGNLVIKDGIKGSEISVDELLKDLQIAINTEPESNINFNELSIPELIDLIRTDHHEYLRGKISELTTMSQQMKRENAIKNVDKIHDLILSSFDHLAPHMLREEKVMFPYLEYMEHMVAKGKTPKPPSFGKVKKSVADMLDEHRDSTNMLEELRDLTNDFTAPQNATKDLSVFFNELKRLDKNLRMHIHLENNVLFTKAKAMAENLH
jgi:regulator of cell morphogenesis and NO signaling